MDLLLSMRAALLLPKPEASVGDMVLFDGPLGRVLGGSDPDLVFGKQRAMVNTVRNVLPTVRTSTFRAHVHDVAYTNLAKTDREILDYFNEENIGAECSVVDVYVVDALLEPRRCHLRMRESTSCFLPS